ncbi:NAD(P)-dependent oxidoreductase [Candidatus Stoquefichus massiliensis]|uniref:NAD(P)-dependent oxidoreductase n=1 Tax=Candidatus Stoquefichus massiliensis TaxID=1470350 RepID=UPI0004840BC6|nr:NAD(P)-dependent oxidoreductase [Candidatus Stoquefichus massiliensis]
MKVFLCEPIHQKAYRQLIENYEVIDSFDNLHECQVIISRNLKINQSLIDQCPLLELVVIHGTGYDDVDIDYLKAKHVHLCNTPSLNALSVAELIVTFVLQLSRQTIRLQKNYIEDKIHTIAPIEYLGHEISHKTFGLIGTGQIALKAAQILHDGFHMNIIAYSRSLTPDRAKELNLTYCQSMEEVFQKADYVSIGTSLNQDTYHMIDRKLLSLMKPTSYLINTSRGAIINENDLYEYLKEKKIAGAALDVLEFEPVKHTHPLLSLDNIVYTPHIGGSTDEALLRVGFAVVQSIDRYNRGELWKDLLF